MNRRGLARGGRRRSQLSSKMRVGRGMNWKDSKKSNTQFAFVREEKLTL
jgi:hypothetical protein